jgi:predicted phage tail protein
MKTLPILYGFGKPNAGSARTPVEETNTLRSRATVRFVDLISEGPLKGFCTSDGTVCSDADIAVQPTIGSKGELVFSPTPALKDGLGGAGYPFSTTYPIKCLIEGTGTTEAEIIAYVYPRNAEEQQQAITAALGYTEIHPEGRVAAIVVRNAGAGYTTAKVTIPPATGQCIFFDGLPLNDEVDLSPNFKDVRYSYRLGFPDQTVLDGFDYVEELISGTPEVTIGNKSGPVIFEIADKFYDRLVINIQTPNGFYVQDVTNGDILGIPESAPIIFNIEYQYNSGTGFGSEWKLFGEGTYRLSGKTMAAYEKSIEGSLFRNKDSEYHEWRIRVTRISPDDADANPSNPSSRHTVLRLGKITGITDAKLSYPGCALIGIEINAEQFSRIPVRSYQMRFLLIQVPTNYFPPHSKRNNGTFRKFAEYNRVVLEGGDVTENVDSAGNPIDVPWDGTFYQEWTNNPAWVAYALCTQQIVGLGDYLPGVADKWGLYSIARYNDQLVRNGYFNGTFALEEPRFRFNSFFQSREHAFKVLGDVASAFRAMLYYSGGHFIFAQDKPKASRAMINTTDVEGGKFTYSGTARRARHTVAVVYFNDPEADFELRPVIYEDFEGRMRYGERKLVITRQGCTSKGEARRAGMEAILSEMANTDTVTFTARMKAAVYRPGDIVEIYDPKRARMPYSGRILGLSVNELGKTLLLLDRAVPLSHFIGGVLNYSVVCSKINGATLDPTEVTTAAELEKVLAAQLTSPVQITALSTGPNGETVLVLNERLPDSVVRGGTWGIKSSTIQPFKARILGIGRPKGGRYEITALEWHEELFDSVDNDTSYSEAPITQNVNSWRKPSPPKNLLIHVNQKYEQEILVYDMTISWTRPDSVVVRGYQVYLQTGLGNYQRITDTPLTSITHRITEAGSYGIRVFAVGIGGELSTPVSGRMLVGALSGTNQEIVSGLEIQGQGNLTEFSSGDVSFDWRINWSGALDSIEQEAAPVLPPIISNYIVKIITVAGVTVMTQDVHSTDFTLTLERNKQLAGGPYREFIISVQAKTVDGGVSAASSIRVYNEAPVVPTFTVTDDRQGSAIVRVTSAKSADFKRYKIWADVVDNFTPTNVNLKFEGDSSLTTVALTPGQWFIRVAELDLLTADDSGLIYSPTQSVLVTNRLRLSAFDFTS